MPKQTLTRCEIRYVRSSYWVFREKVGREWIESPSNHFQGFPTKADFVNIVVHRLRERVEAGEYGFSLRIGNKNGTYSDEITIPRSHDPKKSKG